MKEKKQNQSHRYKEQIIGCPGVEGGWAVSKIRGSRGSNFQLWNKSWGSNVQHSDYGNVVLQIWKSKKVNLKSIHHKKIQCFNFGDRW